MRPDKNLKNCRRRVTAVAEYQGPFHFTNTQFFICRNKYAHTFASTYVTVIYYGSKKNCLAGRRHQCLPYFMRGCSSYFQQRHDDNDVIVVLQEEEIDSLNKCHKF